MKKTIHLDSRRVVFTFDDGGSESICLDELAPGLRTYAALHGLAQKCGDNAAGVSDEGRRRDAVADMIEHLRTANEDGWNRRPVAGMGGNSGLLVRALTQMSGRPASEIKAEVQALTRKEQNALRAVSTVAAVIDSLRKPVAVTPDTAARAQSILAGLMGQ